MDEQNVSEYGRFLQKERFLSLENWENLNITNFQFRNHPSISRINTWFYRKKWRLISISHRFARHYLTKTTQLCISTKS